MSGEVGYKKPPLEHRFKPGQTANPGGRPKSLLTADKIAAKLGEFWVMPRHAIHVLTEDPDAPIGDVMLGKIMLETAKNADHGKLAMLLDRAVGKPKEIAPPKGDGSGLMLTPEDYETVVEIIRRGKPGTNVAP